MNYEKNYYDYINYVKDLNRFKGDGNYYEKHHIKPRSLGGSDSKENLVLLTAREHFLAHYLLCKFTEGEDKKKMVWAFHRLCYSDSSRHVRKENKFKMNSRFYEYLRKEFVKIFESENWKKSCSERSKDRVWINDGKNSKMVKDFELDKFLKEGWAKGRLYIRGRKVKLKKQNGLKQIKTIKNNNKNVQIPVLDGVELLKCKKNEKVWIHNCQEDRMIPSIQVNCFLNKGWVLGRAHKKKASSNGQIGKVAIYNPLTNEERRIDEKDLDIFLSKGFVKGRRKASKETKQKMSKAHLNKEGKSQKYYQSLRDGTSKRKHFEGKIVHKDGIYKGVTLEELDNFLKEGWQIGARPKSDEWKIKVRERNQKKRSEVI